MKMLVVSEKDHSMISVHSWLRLQDDKGNVYSVGKLVKEELDLSEDYDKEVEGFICVGDPYEWSISVDKIASKITITPREFDMLVADIEEDLQKDCVYSINLSYGF